MWFTLAGYTMVSSPEAEHNHTFIVFHIGTCRYEVTVPQVKVYLVQDGTPWQKVTDKEVLKEVLLMVEAGHALPSHLKLGAYTFVGQDNGNYRIFEVTLPSEGTFKQKWMDHLPSPFTFA